MMSAEVAAEQCEPAVAIAAAPVSAARMRALQASESSANAPPISPVRAASRARRARVLVTRAVSVRPGNPKAVGVTADVLRATGAVPAAVLADAAPMYAVPAEVTLATAARAEPSGLHA